MEVETEVCLQYIGTYLVMLSVTFGLHIILLKYEKKKWTVKFFVEDIFLAGYFLFCMSWNEKYTAMGRDTLAKLPQIPYLIFFPIKFVISMEER